MLCILNFETCWITFWPSLAYTTSVGKTKRERESEEEWKKILLNVEAFVHSTSLAVGRLRIWSDRVVVPAGTILHHPAIWLDALLTENMKRVWEATSRYPFQYSHACMLTTQRLVSLCYWATHVSPKRRNRRPCNDGKFLRIVLSFRSMKGTYEYTW